MLRDITLGQYYQADSVIHRLDPRVKLGTTVLFIISLFLFHGLWGYLVAALFLAFVIKLSKVPFRFMIKGMKSIVFLLSITILFNLFLTPGEPLVQIWILRITKEGVRLALLLAIRLAFLIIGSSVMTLTTTPNQLTDGLEKMLKPLNKIKVPVHEIAMMMSIALRFIPILMEETDKIVARGAGIYAGIRMRAADIKDCMMTDVCPFTLGTNVVWDREDDRPHICPVLERNCPLPFSKTIQLYTTGDYQELMRVGIYQGEAYYADENVCLGELLIGVRRRPAGEEGIRVTFSYDINGVLQVEAENAMHQVARKLIVNDALSEKEIEESLIRLEQLKMPDKEAEEYELIHAKLEWLYRQQTGAVRNQTARMLYNLETAREEGKCHLYLKVKEEAKQWLVQASMYLDAFEPES